MNSVVKKDGDTGRLRQLVLASPDVEETNCADWGLTTLSFHSLKIDKRHVWVDTDLAGQLKIDLEDWLDETNWDNAVAHFTAANLETASVIIVAWLAGQSLEACHGLRGQVVDIR